MAPRCGRRLRAVILTGLLAAALPLSAAADPVSFPMRIDYPMLRALVIQSAFTSPGQTAILEDASDSCRKITISDPRFFMKNGKFQFETRLKVTAGTEFAGNCLLPVTWEGYLELFQRPRVDRRTWTLAFDNDDSELLNTHHDPTKLPDVIWEMIETRVFDYLNHITVNLGPPVSDLKTFLLPLFDEESADRARRMIDSMRPGKIETLSDSLTVQIVADAEKFEKAAPVADETLTDQELAAFVHTWESWDAFLVQILEVFSKKSLSDDERRIFFTTLLDTRYRFVEALSDRTAGTRDFVREQFISAWQQLSPVFHNHLGNDPSRGILGYLAFFTAADALSGLDQLGPSFGFEITRDGFIRLAKLIGESGASAELAYGTEVDPALRTLLGMGPPLIVPGPAFDADSIGPETPPIDETVLPEPEKQVPENQAPPENDESEKQEPAGLSSAVRSFFLKSCWAEDKIPEAEMAAVRQWVLSPKNVSELLEQIRAVIEEAVDQTVKKNGVQATFQPVFSQAVTATGWQESCFRQFLEKRGKITYLLSYNNTSVGLMQVNERVWRGIYDVKHLRWNIRYNARAGCEILEQYFTRYALSGKQAGHMDPDTLAGALYAMYNSGPGDLQKYLKRISGGKRLMTDTLFAEKYQWVKKGQWDNIAKCIGGS